MKLVKAVMQVYHSGSADKIAEIELTRATYSTTTRLLVESYIEQCASYADVIALEQSMRSFYMDQCFIVVGMQITD